MLHKVSNYSVLRYITCMTSQRSRPLRIRNQSLYRETSRLQDLYRRTTMKQ
uniref:Uncharacterized protein n=1 Tax=Arundo donax TaxID=35708 RepID=A0A0A9SWP1_ARUDO